MKTYDVNKHPRQDEVNQAFGELIGHIYKEIQVMIKEFNLEPDQTWHQFLECLLEFVERKEYISMRDFRSLKTAAYRWFRQALYTMYMKCKAKK